jgi:phage gpG-like protein
MLTVTLVGDDALAERLEDLPAVVLAAVAARSASLADQLLARVHARLGGEVLQPRSGALDASVGVDGPALAGDQVVTRLFAGADLKYAAIQEYGGVTGPHEILPSRAKALAFLDGGRRVFAKVVHHPGSRLPERSYLRASLAEMASRIDAEMKAAVLDAARQTLET